MELTDISSELRAVFIKCSAASISTQLIRRGLRNVAIRGVRSLKAGPPPMVGPAFTMRYVPAREDLDA